MDDEEYIFGGSAQADARAEEVAERAWEHEMEDQGDDKDESVLLDPFDIAAINAARSVLGALAAHQPEPPTGAEEGWRRDYYMRCLGHLQGQAEAAQNLLFDLLNYAKHHLDVEITNEQLLHPDPQEEEVEF